MAGSFRFNLGDARPGRAGDAGPMTNTTHPLEGTIGRLSPSSPLGNMAAHLTKVAVTAELVHGRSRAKAATSTQGASRSTAPGSQSCRASPTRSSCATR